MNETLIARWLDDRRSLNEEEVAELILDLESDPEGLRRLKDQLAVEHLVSRRLAADRSRFESQVAQRLVASESAAPFFKATMQAVERGAQRRRSWRSWAGEAAAAVLLVAGLSFLLFRQERAPVAATPAEAPKPAPLARGLSAEYFRLRNLSGESFRRIDPNLDFSWPAKTGPRAGWSDSFSARWTGRLTPKTSGVYTFRVDYDDGVRLWVNGVRLVDDFNGRYTITQKRATATLEAGKAVEFKVEYFNGGDIGVLQLYWSGPGMNEEIVPVTVLSHE